MALTCLGRGWHDLIQEGPLFSALWMGFGWSESVALAIHRGGAWALLASIPFVLWHRGWPVLFFVSGWTVLQMAATWHQATWVPLLVPIEWAVRFVGPLALAALTRGRTLEGIVALRAAGATTFFGHGLAAILHNAAFIDLLIVNGRDLIGVDVTENAARITLTVIGIIDILLAIALVLPARLRWVALWMAFWGGVTACARIIRLWPEGWPEAEIRALNVGVPLALFLIWTAALKEKKNET